MYLGLFLSNTSQSLTNRGGGIISMWLKNRGYGSDLTLAHGEIFTWPRFIYNEFKETQLCNRANLKCLMLCCCEHTGETYPRL